MSKPDTIRFTYSSPLVGEDKSRPCYRGWIKVRGREVKKVVTRSEATK
jgi:hypothetical protein